MNKNYFKFLVTILLFGIFSFILPGCSNIGDHQQNTYTVELNNVEKVTATIVIYDGNLNISGLRQVPLLTSYFSYNLTQFIPEISYLVQGNEGKLKITQNDKQKSLFDLIENEWSLLFKRTVPLELDIVMGNGDTYLNLSDINLTELKFAVGAGETNIDLTGDYKKNVQVYLIGGIGSRTINLPDNVGICLFIDGVFNKISCSGFNQIGKFYYNSAFDISERKIFINIINGAGKIDINLI